MREVSNKAELKAALSAEESDVVILGEFADFCVKKYAKSFRGSWAPIIPPEGAFFLNRPLCFFLPLILLVRFPHTKTLAGRLEYYKIRSYVPGRLEIWSPLYALY